MPSGASSGKSWVPPGASSYVSCVSLGGSWVSLGLRHMRLGCHFGTSSYVSCVHLGGSLVPLGLRHMRLGCIFGAPSYGSCVSLGGSWVLSGLRHMRHGCLLGHHRMRLLCASWLVLGAF